MIISTLGVCQNSLNWVEPISALGGALVGGLISFLTTQQFEKRREQDHFRGLAYALFFKLARISNDIEQTREHLTACLGDLAKLNHQADFWPKLSDFVGFSDAEIVFEPDELALVAGMKDQNFTMKLMEIEAGHRIVVSSLAKIADLRQRLADSGLAKELNGNVVSFEATKEEFAAIGPTILNLESFIQSLVKNVPSLSDLCRTTSKELAPKIKSHYKFKNFITLDFDGKGSVKQPA